MIKECKAAASKNLVSLTIYQSLKAEYSDNKYTQFWNLAEGYCNISIANYSQAIPLLTQVIAGEPNNAEGLWIKAAHLYLAIVYYGMNDFPKAEEHLAIALNMGGNNIIDIICHFTYAKIYEKQGQSQKAFEKYSLIIQKYGSDTNSDIKEIVDISKIQAEALLGFTVVNVTDQLPPKGIVGVKQTLKYEALKNSDINGTFSWVSSSSKIRVTTGGANHEMAYIKGVSASSSFEDMVLAVTFKTVDNFEYKLDFKMTCIDVEIIEADQFFPYAGSEQANFKYKMSPDLPETDITFIVEKGGVSGYEMTFSNTGKIIWKGIYNNVSASVGQYQFIIRAQKGNGIVELSDSLTVFDVDIKGKEVVYLDSSPMFDAVSSPEIEGTFKWVGSDNVTIVSPNQKETSIKGIKLGTFDLKLSFTPTGSRLSANDSKKISVNDPISISLVKPTSNPLFMNQNQQLEYTAKAVHVQGDPVNGTFTWNCNLGQFSKTSFSNVNECSTLFTAETIGASVMQIEFTTDGRTRILERPIYVDKHIAIPKFTFFPESDVQLDIDETQEFSVECRYNGDVIEKIGIWYDISEILKYRVNELKYEDDKGLLEEIPGYDQSIPIRGFKALKHGKSVLTAIVNYEIEKKVKGKWRRFGFSKKHDHVFRVVPPIVIKWTAQRLFKKDGTVNKTIVIVTPDLAGRKIKIGKIYSHKGYQFKLESLNWDTTLGEIKKTELGTAELVIPVDEVKKFAVFITGAIKIIDRDIDVVKLKKTELKMAVIDPQIEVKLNPGLNSKTIAGVYEFFNIEYITVKIPSFKINKTFVNNENLNLGSIYDISLSLNFFWSLFQNTANYEAQNKFQYEKVVKSEWNQVSLSMKYDVGGMLMEQILFSNIVVQQLQQIVKTKIKGKRDYTVLGKTLDLSYFLNEKNSNEIELLEDYIEI